ncbi:HET-domain-containing protein, partial [Hyaloscypha variabilis F]
PAFAILSHTWGDQECSLQNIDDPEGKSRTGYMKINNCCEQALKDGLEWAWIDTCCIDKTSSAELSEAINSMFRFYRNAAICYAYLSDVTDLSELEKSRWFTRGWTLQELVAPKEVLFYSSTWTLLGSKLEISDRVSKITNIDTQVLATGAFHHINIAGRMSWAAGRQTTRVEDLAYCLMGIFDINMPLLYGEGEKSFIRLQEEIFRVSEDPSLFAW